MDTMATGAGRRVTKRRSCVRGRCRQDSHLKTRWDAVGFHTNEYLNPLLARESCRPVGTVAMAGLQTGQDTPPAATGKAVVGTPPPCFFSFFLVTVAPKFLNNPLAWKARVGAVVRQTIPLPAGCLGGPTFCDREAVTQRQVSVGSASRPFQLVERLCGLCAIYTAGRGGAKFSLGSDKSRPEKKTHHSANQRRGSALGDQSEASRRGGAAACGAANIHASQTARPSFSQIRRKERVAQGRKMREMVLVGLRPSASTNPKHHIPTSTSGSTAVSTPKAVTLQRPKMNATATMMPTMLPAVSRKRKIILDSFPEHKRHRTWTELEYEMMLEEATLLCEELELLLAVAADLCRDLTCDPSQVQHFTATLRQIEEHLVSTDDLTERQVRVMCQQMIAMMQYLCQRHYDHFGLIEMQDQLRECRDRFMRFICQYAAMVGLYQ